MLGKKSKGGSRRFSFRYEENDRIAISAGLPFAEDDGFVTRYATARLRFLSLEVAPKA